MASAQWFAVWTHSHCEQLVHDQLTAKGLRAVDKASHLEILKTKGVVRILGERWDRLTPVADVEIEALQRVVNSDLMVLPHSYLREGQRVRIEAGPLAGVEGLFVRSQPNRGLLVLSVNRLDLYADWRRRHRSTRWTPVCRSSSIRSSVVRTCR